MTGVEKGWFLGRRWGDQSAVHLGLGCVKSRRSFGRMSPEVFFSLDKEREESNRAVDCCGGCLCRKGDAKWRGEKEDRYGDCR